MSELSVNLNAVKKIHSESCAGIANETQLMHRVATGEETAFVELIALHNDSLSQLIGRLTAWHTDSEDILQEVFLTAWQKADSFKGNGSVEGWLKRIAINRCRNHFRSLSVIKRHIERFANMVVMNVGPEKHIVGECNESYSELKQAISALPNEDRMLLVLYYLEEMPGNEVAGLLKIKPETLHVRLHRSRKRLKSILESKK